MKIVSLEKEFGDLLLRHGGRYSKTGIKSSGRVSVLMPDEDAEYLHTFDSANAVSDNDDATDVFADFAVTKVAAGYAPSADYATNQTAITVTKVDDNHYTISSDWSSMKDIVSPDPYWASFGAQPWFCLLISTGVADITQIKFNGASLSAGDAQEAAAYGGTTGDFAFWTYPKVGDVIFTLTYDGKSCIIYISFVNTATE